MNKKRIVCIAMVVCFISLKISTISLADEKNDSSDGERYEKQTTSTEDRSVRVVSGKWIKDSMGWWYRHSDGSYTTNDWEYIAGEWYYFNKQGYMCIFREICASVPKERSAIPLETEQRSVGN